MFFLMQKIRKKWPLWISLALALVVFNCNDDDGRQQVVSSPVEVDFDVSQLLRAAGSAESGRVTSELSEASTILVTVTQSDGTATDFSLAQLTLFDLEGQFITEKISLAPGSYEVAEFLVVDTENNITHIAPLADSEQAQHVTAPLPIAFEVSTGVASTVPVEILTTEAFTLEDFGLVNFDLSNVGLMNFVVSVSERGANTLLAATLEVTSGSYTFTKELTAAIGHGISIKDEYDTYDLTITSDGYETYAFTFTRDSLQQHVSYPLIVELKPLKVAEATTFAKNFGGSLADYARSIAATTDGGYVVAGWVHSGDGDITNRKGGVDYWIVKLDAAGTIVWEKSLGGSHNDYASSIATTTDGGYVVAGTSYSTDGDITNPKGGQDYWIVKLDAEGTLVWEKSLGGSLNGSPYAITSTTDGGCVVAGWTNSIDGDITDPKGIADYWIVKLDAAGTLVWEKSLGGSGTDYAESIQQTTDGGYIVAGKTNSNDGDITNRKGGYDYWIVKLDAEGDMVWEKSLGGSGWDEAKSIQQTTDEGYIVTGWTDSNDGDITSPRGGRDYWIVKLDASGSLVWEKSLGGSDWDEAKSIQQTTDGGYLVAGGTDSSDGDITSQKGSGDFWIVKLDAAGTLVWEKSLGGSGSDGAHSIVPTTDGGHVVAGHSHSTDGDITEPKGIVDYWIVKLDAEGNL